MWDFWAGLDFAWVGELTGAIWQGVANMIASFSPLLALMIGLSLAFVVVGAIVNLVLRRKEEQSWW